MRGGAEVRIDYQLLLPQLALSLTAAIQCTFPTFYLGTLDCCWCWWLGSNINNNKVRQKRLNCDRWCSSEQESNCTKMSTTLLSFCHVRLLVSIFVSSFICQILEISPYLGRQLEFAWTDSDFTHCWAVVDGFFLDCRTQTTAVAVKAALILTLLFTFIFLFGANRFYSVCLHCLPL